MDKVKENKKKKRKRRKKKKKKKGLEGEETRDEKRRRDDISKREKKKERRIYRERGGMVGEAWGCERVKENRWKGLELVGVAASLASHCDDRDAPTSRGAICPLLTLKIVVIFLHTYYFTDFPSRYDVGTLRRVSRCCGVCIFLFFFSKRVVGWNRNKSAVFSSSGGEFRLFLFRPL